MILSRRMAAYRASGSVRVAPREPVTLAPVAADSAATEPQRQAPAQAERVPALREPQQRGNRR